MDKDKNTNLCDVLKIEGVNAKGYGIVPKIIMQDQRLTRDAKAIYCYFASFAGKGDTAFPSVAKICYDLGFKTEDTYRKHFKLLKEYDYIRVSQQRNSSGKFNRNIYTLVSNPDPKENNIGKSTIEASVVPTPKKQGYGKRSNRTTINPAPKKTGYGENPAPEKKGDNINSSGKSNSISINNTTRKSVIADIDIMNLLKKINCKFYEYELNDEDIKSILTTYSGDMDLLKNVLVYIANNEPEVGYNNITGRIISAKSWAIEDTPKKQGIPGVKAKKYKNRFHNFEQATDKYTAQELEAVAKRKRDEHFEKLRTKLDKS